MSNPLQPIEVEILQKIADGYILKQIAPQFGISESAISLRLERARERVKGGATTTAFVATAIRCGWIN